MKSKETTINLINKKNSQCFQQAITVALNQGEIGKHTERIAKVRPFIDNHNWEGINYPSEKDDCKKFEKK